MARNFISNKDESVRMFKNDVLESFTRVHFTIPLILFMPVIIFFLYKCFFVLHISTLLFAGMVPVGIAIWTLTEYVLHRYVFHFEPTSAFGRTIHFYVHGVHHDYPSDSRRLVMVPAMSIPLAFLFYYLFYFIFGSVLVAPFFIGFLAGYLFYDTTHYALHHFNFKSKFWLDLKQHHMLHHFKDSEHGYGVSSKFWDHVFRSMFPFKKKQNTELESQ